MCVAEEELSAGPTLDRPLLRQTLERLAAGDAHILVVSSIDRLALSFQDLAVVLQWFEDSAGASLVSIGGTFPVDMTREDGQTLVSALVALGAWDRTCSSQRAQEALLATRARGLPISRPAVADQPGLKDLVRTLRGRGLTLREIADMLNRAEIPTLRGGQEWRPSSLQSILGYRRQPRTRKGTLPPPRPVVDPAAGDIGEMVDL